MKRYAAHRVYLAAKKEWCEGPQVVSVEEGKVLSLTPFAGELPSVEWLGGLLIVASRLPERRPDEPFSCFLERIPPVAADDSATLSLWHVTSFNVHDMAFTAVSRIIRV